MQGGDTSSGMHVAGLPARCTKSLGLAGKSKLTTLSSKGMSRPRAATSVTTRIRALPALNLPMWMRRAVCAVQRELCELCHADAACMSCMTNQLQFDRHEPHLTASCMKETTNAGALNCPAAWLVCNILPAQPNAANWLSGLCAYEHACSLWHWLSLQINGLRWRTWSMAPYTHAHGRPSEDSRENSSSTWCRVAANTMLCCCSWSTVSRSSHMRAASLSSALCSTHRHRQDLSLPAAQTLSRAVWSGSCAWCKLHHSTLSHESV